MKQETKDKLAHALIIAAMVTPPWNIFWWTVGAIYYSASGGRKWDTSGDGALGLVLGAPVTLPMLPFMLLKERRELRKLQKSEARFRETAEWIAERLRSRDIAVTKADSTMFGVTVEATPTAAQVCAYQDTIAEAMRRFPDVLAARDLRNHSFSPAEHLGRAWAERHGFTNWAEEVHTGPCVDCGNEDSLGFRFGREAIRFMREYVTNVQHRVSFKDGGSRVIDGHICRECLDRLGWSSMSSGRRTPGT